MDAVRFIKEINRMCKIIYHDCSDYPLDKVSYCNRKEIQKNGLKAIEIVEEWSRNHPQKTFLQDFLEKYPKAPLESDNTPKVCPYQCGYTLETMCGRTSETRCGKYIYKEYRNCIECWNRPMED